jgi:hypothetical protein
MSTIIEPHPDERAFTIREFCVAEHISRASYYKLRTLGVGPRESRISGTTIVRITQAARRAWHEQLAEVRQSREAELEERRRSAQAAQAGRIAAASPLHPSKRSRREVRPASGGAAQTPARAADPGAMLQNLSTFDGRRK